jgi:hypothetical protein
MRLRSLEAAVAESATPLIGIAPLREDGSPPSRPCGPGPRRSRYWRNASSPPKPLWSSTSACRIKPARPRRGVASCGRCFSRHRRHLRCVADRRDLIPAAIEAAGRTIGHLGMPVDPGNLLLLAEMGGVSVLGVPGCARSPNENGFD